MANFVYLKHLTTELLDLLNSDPIQNLNIIGILENSAPDTLEILVDSHEKPTGVLVKKGYFCYVYSQSTLFLDTLVNDYFDEDFYGFSGLSSFVATYLEPHFTLQWKEVCDIYYLPTGALKTELKKRPVKFIPIAYAEEINSYYTYKDAYSIFKIKERLLNSSSSGYFEGDQLCSWALVHDDNSLGVMFTKDIYRGQGLAVDVTIDLCMKEIERGKQPYVQISTENTMSPGLAQKCGFIHYNPLANHSVGDAIWFGGYKGVPKAFKTVGDALGVCITQLLSLYSITSSGEPSKIRVVERGTERPIESPIAIRESKNCERVFEIFSEEFSLGDIKCIVHDEYWCYVKELDERLIEGTLFVTFIEFLKSLKMESVLFNDIKLPVDYRVVNL